MATNRVNGDFNTLSTGIDEAAINIGKTMSSSQDLVMKAFSMSDGASEAELKGLADALGYNYADSKSLNVRGLQLVAERKFQQSSNLVSLFSGVLDKIDQLKQRIIGNISR